MIRVIYPKLQLKKDQEDKKYILKILRGDFTKTLGIIGGLGPMATAYLYELIIEMIDANNDQEHIETIIYSKPSIPDRTDYILGKSLKNPLKDMIGVGNKLVKMGADYIALPCITGHAFYEELTLEIEKPIIHIIRETASYLKAMGIKKVGLMATDGSIASGLFCEALNQQGIECIMPTEEKQKDIMYLIYKNVKANKPVEMDKFDKAHRELKDRGSELVILGCTELSIIKRDYSIGPGFLDTMDILASKSIKLCGGRLKEKYKCLISK